MSLQNIYQSVKKFACPERAANLQRFFKSGKGQYGEGDKFVGLTNPVSRAICKENKLIPLSSLETLIRSKIHQERLIALLILVEQFKKSSNKNVFVELYLRNIDQVNNWDLVDLSAPQILGAYLLKNPSECKILYELASSEKLFEKRVSIISTLAFIRAHSFNDTLKISQTLLADKHDLIHKAVGWMLREVGKRDQLILEQFLQQKYDQIPRTTLRYAIQKFPEPLRKIYLKKQFQLIKCQYQ